MIYHSEFLEFSISLALLVLLDTRFTVTVHNTRNTHLEPGAVEGWLIHLEPSGCRRLLSAVEMLTG